MKPKASSLKACARAFHLAFAFVFLFQAHGQGTAFTYQGRITDAAAAPTGTYDFQFSLYDAATDGAVLGTPVSQNAVAVNAGFFTVTLDFGSNVFTGPERWLQLAVRTNGAASFAALSPRQRIASTPYAVAAANLTGSVGAGALAGTYSNAVTLNNLANVFAGSFAGNGGALNSLDAGQLSAGTIPDARLPLSLARTNQVWLLGGNTGADPGQGNFVGTADDQPLELKVNGTRALRIEPNTNGAPNMIGGAPVNFVDPGVVGATIAGGGAVSGSFFLGTGSNHVAAIFGTIGGGRMNTVGADHGFIGGGIGNTVQTFAYDSVIGGGVQNIVQTNGFRDVIGGGDFNVIQAYADHSFIGGGGFNTIVGSTSLPVYGTISGGRNNSVQTNASYSTVGGGYFNSVTGSYGVIPGGDRNVATTNSFAAGRRARAIHPGSFVWGDATEQDVSSTATNQFVVRAGGGMRILTGGAGVTVDGQPLPLPQLVPNSFGVTNVVNVVNGSSVNYVTNGVVGATISGGGAGYWFNAAFSNVVLGSFGTIGGGLDNTISNSGWYSTIAGGNDNRVGGSSSTVGGGSQNTAIGFTATVAGGAANRATEQSCVGGGGGNTANGGGATVPGGESNTADGYCTFAAGYQARALHPNTFIWNDSQGNDGSHHFTSTGPNQFLIHASGNVGINTASPGAALEVRTTAPSGNVLRFGYAAGGAGNLIAGPSHVGIATDNLVEKVTINQASGNVGINITDPQTQLHVYGAEGAQLRLQNSANNKLWTIYTESFNNSGYLLFVAGSGNFIYFDTDGVIHSASDKRLKRDITPLGGVLDRVMKLQPVAYHFRSEGTNQVRTLGLIAQEVEPLFPEVVGEHAGMKSLAYSELVPVTIGAIQELNHKLEKQLQQKEARIAELEHRLAAVEKFISSVNHEPK